MSTPYDDVDDAATVFLLMEKQAKSLFSEKKLRKALSDKKSLAHWTYKLGYWHAMMNAKIEK